MSVFQRVIEMPQSTPSPLWGGIKGGGRLAPISGLSHPLPASPVKGEVPHRVCGMIQLVSPHATASLLGKASAGRNHMHSTNDINSRETSHG